VGACAAAGRLQSPTQQRRQTLLQKLLAPDIRKEHSRLLQCLRFLVTNNFLLNYGRAPLIFPPEPAALNDALPGENNFAPGCATHDQVIAYEHYCLLNSLHASIEHRASSAAHGKECRMQNRDTDCLALWCRL
jgi:hypothetical protein